MKTNKKSLGDNYLFAVTPLLFLCFLLTSSTHDKPKEREVLTSQQLFVVEVSENNAQSGNSAVNFKAELRDAFKIIAYTQDSTFIEVDWAMCPNNNCPKAGQYRYGSAGYEGLDALIEAERIKMFKKKP